MPMRTVYHIFEGRKVHHVPHMISMFQRLESPQVRQFYVLTGLPRGRGEAYARTVSGVPRGRLVLSGSGINLLLMMSLNVLARDVVFLSHSAAIRLMSLFSVLSAPLRRCAVKWVCWGPGIESKPGLLGRLGALVKRISYSSYDQVVCLTAPDAGMMTRGLGVRGEVSVIPYLVDPSDLAPPGPPLPGLRDGKINILVGHSASPANDHLKLFGLLSKFRDEDFRVISFLSYSDRDRDYVARVIGRGEQLFKDRFVYFRDLLSRPDYFSVMAAVDVTILPQKKQAGGAAIYQTVRQGGVVVLSEAGRNRAWMSSLGIRTLGLGDLERAASLAEALAMIPERDRSESALRLARALDPGRLAGLWRSVMLGRRSRRAGRGEADGGPPGRSGTK